MVGPVRRVIFKYSPDISGCVELPADSRIIHANTQDSMPTLWVECLAYKPLVKRYFKVVGTGGEVPENGEHVATYFEGVYVFHLYEVW